MHHAANTNSEGKKSPHYDLCPACYQNGRFSQAQQASEFVQLKDMSHDCVPDSQSPWSESELLLLLEALETEDDNWTRVAEHVRTRTREECVLKFLQLEIEDSYMEDQAPALEQRFGPLDYQNVPFTQADNPVMSVVAFLAGLTDPGIVKAATGRSIEALSKKMQKKIENGVPGPDATKRDATHGTVVEESEDTASKGKAPEAPAPVDSTTATTTTPPKTELQQPPTDPSAMDLDDVPAPAPITNNNQVSTTQPSPPPATDLPTLALSTSAARAFSLASNEEREMTRLVSSAVNLTLQKLELKMKQFQELEGVLARERRELEIGRRELFLEKLEFRRMVREGKIPENAEGNEGVRMMVGEEEDEGDDTGVGEVRPFSEEDGGKSLEI